MKLHLYLSALLLLTALQSFSQDKPVAFGLRAGVNMSSLSRKPARDIVVHPGEGYAPGYFAGVFAEIKIGVFSLQPAAVFNALAGKSTEETLTGDIIDDSYGTWKLNYLQLPVNLLYNIRTESGRFYVGAGPYFASALSGKFTPDGNGIEEGSYKQQYIDYHTTKAKFGDDKQSNFKSTDYGVNMVAGVELSKHFSLNGAYSYGLANISGKNQKGYLYKSGHISSFSISAGYKF